MRPHVDFIDTAEIPEINPRPGTYSRILSRDPETTARTALVRVVPQDGHVDQAQPHCHETSEEIFVVSGMMAFDSRCWLHAGGYIYHPPRWVHGFNSNVPVESAFVSRVSGDLRFTYFDTPRDDYPYLEGEAVNGRDAVIVASPWAQRWPVIASAEGQIREFLYSDDPSAGERSVLRRYDVGALDAAPPSATLDRCEEYFVQEGVVEDENGARYGKGFYACKAEADDAGFKPE